MKKLIKSLSAICLAVAAVGFVACNKQSKNDNGANLLDESKNVHTHNYVEIITKQPTATEKGEKRFVCDCTATYTATFFSETDEPVVERYSEGLSYMLSADKTYYAVTGLGSCGDQTIVIPAEYKGLPIKEIANRAFWNNATILNVKLPAGITSIGDYAFYGCTALTNVSLPEGVTEIGKSAFASCFALTEISLPKSLTNIGERAFIECFNLTSITLPETLKEIPAQAFSGCTALTSVNFNKVVEKIGAYAFNGCAGLKTIKIPTTVETIGEYAFADCDGLTSISIQISSLTRSRVVPL